MHTLIKIVAARNWLHSTALTWVARDATGIPLHDMRLDDWLKGWVDVKRNTKHSDMDMKKLEIGVQGKKPVSPPATLPP